jgi:hypothetical protein
LYVVMNPSPIFFCAHNFLLKTKNPRVFNPRVL